MNYVTIMLKYFHNLTFHYLTSLCYVKSRFVKLFMIVSFDALKTFRKSLIVALLLIFFPYFQKLGFSETKYNSRCFQNYILLTVKILTDLTLFLFSYHLDFQSQFFFSLYSNLSSFPIEV